MQTCLWSHPRAELDHSWLHGAHFTEESSCPDTPPRKLRATQYCGHERFLTAIKVNWRMLPSPRTQAAEIANSCGDPINQNPHAHVPQALADSGILDEVRLQLYKIVLLMSP